jgi:hypothetical protein
MQLRRLSVVLCLLSSMSTFAQEDELARAGAERRVEQPAHHYAEALSVSMLSGTGISLFGGGTYGSTGGLSVLTVGNQAVVSVGLGADVRIGLHGFLIDLGFGLTYGGGGSGGGSVALLPSVGLGYAVATSTHFALSPLVRGSFTILSPGPAFITVGAELPMTFFIGRHGFMEPFIFAGFLTSTQGGSPAFSGTIGYRLGVTF